MQIEYRKPSVLASKEKTSFSVCVSACDITGDPVLIAGDYGSVPGSSDLATTAASRGDRSHSDDVLFCTEILVAGRSAGNWYSDFNIIFKDAGKRPWSALFSLFCRLFS